MPGVEKVVLVDTASVDLSARRDDWVITFEDLAANAGGAGFGILQDAGLGGFGRNTGRKAVRGDGMGDKPLHRVSRQAGILQPAQPRPIEARPRIGLASGCHVLVSDDLADRAPLVHPLFPVLWESA